MTRREFYDRAASAAELEAARAIDGLDDEIALLRLEIRRLIADDAPDPRLVQGAMRLLVQGVMAQHRLNGRQAEGLTAAVANMFEEFLAAMSPDGGGA
jgi:hypothetical protein